MTKRPYKRRPGDLEIRLLRDGRLVFIGPDQALIDLAQGLEISAGDKKERTGNGRDSGEIDPSRE
jgi:hypothetical protein